MARKERILDSEIQKAEKLNDLFRWILSVITAVTLGGAVLIWIFVNP